MMIRSQLMSLIANFIPTAYTWMEIIRITVSLAKANTNFFLMVKLTELSTAKEIF